MAPQKRKKMGTTSRPSNFKFLNHLQLLPAEEKILCSYKAPQPHYASYRLAFGLHLVLDEYTAASSDSHPNPTFPAMD